MAGWLEYHLETANQFVFQVMVFIVLELLLAGAAFHSGEFYAGG